MISNACDATSRVENPEIFLEACIEGPRVVFKIDKGYLLPTSQPRLDQKNYDLIICDIDLPDMEGLELLDKTSQNDRLFLLRATTMSLLESTDLPSRTDLLKNPSILSICCHKQLNMFRNCEIDYLHYIQYTIHRR